MVRYENYADDGKGYDGREISLKLEVEFGEKLAPESDPLSYANFDVTFAEQKSKREDGTIISFWRPNDALARGQYDCWHTKMIKDFVLTKKF